MQKYLLAFLIALLVSYVSTPYVKKLAISIGAIDRPDARKVHVRPIPRLGGIAIYLGFLLAVLLTLKIDRQTAGILVGGTMVMLLGVLDDKYQLAAKTKLAGQILAAVVLVWFGVKIEWVTNPFAHMFYIGVWGIPLTVLWVVGITNTVNLIDGLDGLAAGVSSIASITLLLVAFQQNQPAIVILTAALAGSAIGFLQHNFNPAKIFMGDTGSMFLGFTLAAVSVGGLMKSAATIALLVPILALGLPIFDTAMAIVRRLLNGNPIFQPDKGHLHHRLLDKGLTQKQTVLLMYLISGCLGVSAILLTEVKGIIAYGMATVIVLTLCWGAKKLGVVQSKPSKNVDAN